MDVWRIDYSEINRGMKILKQVLGKAIQFGGHEHSGWLPANALAPQSTPIVNAVLDIQILETEGGYILEWKSRNTNHSNDSWHKTVEDAERQAKIQFDVKPSEWEKLG